MDKLYIIELLSSLKLNQNLIDTVSIWFTQHDLLHQSYVHFVDQFIVYTNSLTLSLPTIKIWFKNWLRLIDARQFLTTGEVSKHSEHAYIVVN
tara:strand:+ start:491 stop:769 length:279 start_codon:yes stop_codon:yes gene_type:complete